MGAAASHPGLQAAADTVLCNKLGFTGSSQLTGSDLSPWLSKEVPLRAVSHSVSV